MFSTSSPTYPASVRVVASAMVNGTLRMRASVWRGASSRCRGAKQEDVRLLQLDAVALARLDPLVMVVDGDGKDLLRALLADHVIVERLLDLGGLREAATLLLEVPLGLVLLGDDVVAQLDALVADVDRGPAMSLRTSFCAFPQKEQTSRFALSLNFRVKGASVSRPGV